MLKHVLVPLVAALALAACQNAEVMPVGSGALGGSGPAAAPAAGSGSGNPGSTVTLPDAGANPAPSPPGPGERCAEDSHQAEQIPVDLLLLVDTSGSMKVLGGNRSKWSRATEGLIGFLKDPRSAGLGVGLQFFPTLAPEKVCTADSQCPMLGIFPNPCAQREACGTAGTPLPNDALDCDGVLDDCPVGLTCLPIGRCSMGGARCVGVGQPCVGGGSCELAPRSCGFNSNAWCAGPYDRMAVPIAPLPAAEPALTGALGAVIPRGGTPLGPAVRGALGQLRTHLQATPGHRGALVLVSDGLPDGFCGGNYIDMIVPNVRAAQMATPSIPTYVIGVFAEDEIAEARPGLEQMATAGGSGMPYVLTAMDDLSQRFQEALNRIRGTALTCEFTIPAPRMGMGAIDFGKVNVRSKVAGGDQDLLYVGSKDRCDPMKGGWYFDVDPTSGTTPGRVLLCDASCNAIKASAGSRVEVSYGCKTRVLD